MMSFSRFPFSSPLRLMPLALALTLAGCGSLMHTPYEAPKTDTPAHWAQRTTATDMRADQWWKAFGDVELDRLIDDALAKNNNLAVAAIKVRSAQLAAGLADDARIPALGASVSTTDNKQLRNSRALTKTSSATVSLSYEADLWGRLGSTYDAKRWEALATEQDRQSTALTLIGTTAGFYWTGAYLNQRLSLSEQSIAYAQKTLDLVRTQYQAGGASYVDVLTAEQNLLTQQSTRTQLLQQQVENNNALAILFDSPPGKTFALPPRLPTFALPVLAAGLPAELLGRRPDLRAAELRLRSYLSNVDATRASYYPKLTLTGSVGGSSAALRDVLLNPIAALGAGLTLPFLQWNEMQLNVKVSQATYESAVVSFRQTLYSAFSDVENALSARQQYEAQEALLARNLQAAQEAEHRYEIRYRAGYSPLKDWLDAQESRRTAEISLAEVRLSRLKNQMTLYQAIGGDMQGDETQAESAAGMSRPSSY